MNYERIAAGLQKRFAESVSRYEGDIALLQENANQQIEALNEQNENLKKQIEVLHGRVNELEGETSVAVQDEAAGDSPAADSTD